jgi:hypothetical protein
MYVCTCILKLLKQDETSKIILRGTRVKLNVYMFILCLK